MRYTTLALALALALASLSVSAPSAQEKIDRDINWKIRREATDNSQILRTLHFLTDVYGPRLTGSPSLKAAQDWVVKETSAWGLKNAHLEPWSFGHPGWVNEKLSVHVISPVKDSLVTEALAWTPGTNGPVTAQAVQLVVPTQPTKEVLTKFFDDNRAKVKGKIAMVGAPAEVRVTILTPQKRREDNEVRAQYDPNATAGGGPGGPPGGGPPPAPNRNVVSAGQVAEQLDQFLVSAGAAGRINDAGREHGQIRAFNNRTFDIAKAVPTVVMRNEDYGRLSRLIADGRTVELELNIVNRSYPEGATAYNVVAEIPGTDKAQEVVMLGGHIDSWHSATGATDNAIGCATMLEAIRILNAIGVMPRRTIRVALWSGEEQGLLGSQAYVKEHFGMIENAKPEHANFAGYFNIDSGTGRARGMSVFGPSEAASILREATRPFEDNGFFGVSATQSRRRGGTDSTSFNEAGLPGIGIQQDPIEYNSHTWHTNLDTYERIIEDDARQSAMVIAAAVYHLAMRDEKLPRLPREKMPPLPLATGMPAPTIAASSSCEGLASLTLPSGTITVAQSVPAGGFTPPGGARDGSEGAFRRLSAFCRVAATLRPSADSDIKIEVWLPTSGWNSKYQAVGNGGWAGTISYPAMAGALERGYATSSTDTGHTVASANFALGHPEKLIDYAYRSEHEMTVAAKAIVSAFYSSSPTRSYFNGCSTGGRQALVEAQRYPNDFDGIIAGAAANPKTRLDSWRIWMSQAMLKDKDSFIPPSKHPMIHGAVLDTCDALDGVKDGLIENPTRCTFDPKTLACRGSDAPGCLTAAQVEAATVVMSPVKNRKTGELIFPGLEPGSELGWARLLGSQQAYDTAVDQFKYIVFNNPNWDWRTFELERDVAASDAAANGVLASVNPDLTAFAQRGGKLLTYHGWADPSIAPQASINFYKRALSATKPPAQSPDWLRLFMVPGMGHCRGGEGPDTFDMVAALESWVEQGQAPTRVLASHSTAGKVDRTRPLCPYPQVARYSGTGSIDDAANFTCQAP